MEDLLLDREQWVIVDPATKPISTLKKDWEKMERKARSMIRLSLSNLVLLNVFGEDNSKAMWDKLGNLYLSKYPVNKFLQKDCIILGWMMATL